MKEWLKHYYYQLPHLRKLNELLWSSVYHDSIKALPEINELPLNIGRFAASYNLLYLLHRIITISNPERVLEIGLGESTKFISCYLTNYSNHTEHIVVEHDKTWINVFSQYSLPQCSRIEQLDLIETKFRNKFSSLNYKNFGTLSKYGTYSIILVDGPFGKNRFSRNDILPHIESLINFDDFIIIFDDTNRYGEYETFRALKKKLRNLNVEFQDTRYYGDKIISMIYSKNYKFLDTL